MDEHYHSTYYYEIAINIPLNKLFLYRSNLNLEIGIRVMVNFNGSNKIGIIIKKYPKNEFKEKFEFKIKEIIKIIDKTKIITEHNIDLAHWISRKTFSGFGETLFFGLPKNSKSKKNQTLPSINEYPYPDHKKHLQLNNEQQNIYKEIIGSEKNNVFYLFGIPGSGKTEIFIKLCEHYLTLEQQVLFLIPEISLGYQIIKRIKYALNMHHKIYEYNSKVSNSNKNLIWNKVKNGESMIVVGIKSVLMLPFTKLKLIIMDEEHETTYKSENIPRFHSRHISFFLQKKFNAKFIMGSATPSLEAYHAMKHNQIKKIIMQNKFFQSKIEDIKIINMKKEPSTISSELLYSIQKSLNEKRQSLIFINKRGYLKNLECNECGHTIYCPNCSFSMIYHKKENKLLCHYCSYKTKTASNCPQCESKDIKYKTYGIQLVEKELKKFLPNAKIARIDSDITKIENIDSISKFENKEIDILIGTQIIAKGFNFENIKTLGIINADIGIGLPDFRSSERIFTTLSQIMGRVARFKDDNTIIIQTKNPNYYAIKCAYKSQYEEFYEQELDIRKKLNYPPFNKIIRIIFRSKNEESAKQKCWEFFEKSKEFLQEGIEHLGPSEAIMKKISKNYRYNIIYLSKSYGLLEKLANKTREKVKLTNTVYIEIDYYPISLI
nr:primosomal protein N' [Borreliella bavariensis]